MRRLTFMVVALAALASAERASAEMVVGVAAPLSGPSAILGEQVRAGATVASAMLPEPKIRLEVADDKCSAEGGAEAARRFAEQQAGIVIGFLCTEAIEAALPILKAANIPVITVGVRTDSLTDRRQKTRWPVYRLGPRADSEREAAARILTRLWEKDPFAIVDDGTIYGREMSESIRLAAEQAGLKPVFVDTFRPQLDNQIGLVGRLKKADAAKVFAGGDRDDIAVIGRDAAALKVPLQIAGGETLRAAPGAVPLPAGTLMIALPEWSADLDPTLAGAFERSGTIPVGYVLPAYAAVQVARQAFRESGADPAAGLSAGDFSTVVGRVRFDEKGDLARNPFGLFRYDGRSFLPLDRP